MMTRNVEANLLAVRVFTAATAAPLFIITDFVEMIMEMLRKNEGKRIWSIATLFTLSVVIACQLAENLLDQEIELAIETIRLISRIGIILELLTATAAISSLMVLGNVMFGSNVTIASDNKTAKLFVNHFANLKRSFSRILNYQHSCSKPDLQPKNLSSTENEKILSDINLRGFFFYNFWIEIYLLIIHFFKILIPKFAKSSIEFPSPSLSIIFSRIELSRSLF